MSERVLLMVGPRRRKAEGTVVGSDVLPRRYAVGVSGEAHFAGVVQLLRCAYLRPQSDRGESKSSACSLNSRPLSDRKEVK